MLDDWKLKGGMREREREREGVDQSCFKTGTKSQNPGISRPVKRFPLLSTKSKRAK